MVKSARPIDIYLRVSRVGKRENLISPDEQERRARDLAHDQGLDVGIVLTDLDESGGKWKRPGLQEALRRVESRESGGVIVAWLDRLSRDSEHAHALVRRIGEAGGRIYAPDAPADWTTPEGELQGTIFFAFAAYTRNRARAGFERAKERAIGAGIPANPRAAIGLRKREDRRLEPDPEIAPVIRQVFERRAAGAGPTELGRFMLAHGVKPHAAEGWSTRTIYALLRNPIYKGVLSYGGRYVNETAVEPIVDLATWEAAQRPKRTLARAGAESSWLLSGIIRCEACRHCLQGTPDGKGTRVYRCARHHGDGDCPAPARVMADEAEAEIVAAFWSLTENIAAHGTANTGEDAATAQDALDAAQTRLQRYLAPEVQDALDPAVWAAGLRERQDAVTTAAAALGHARSEKPSNLEGSDVQTLRDAWERAPIVQRRELLALRLDAVAARGSRNGERELTVWPAGTLTGECWPSRGRRKRGESIPPLRPFPAAAIEIAR